MSLSNFIGFGMSAIGYVGDNCWRWCHETPMHDYSLFLKIFKKRLAREIETKRFDILHRFGADYHVVEYNGEQVHIYVERNFFRPGLYGKANNQLLKAVKRIWLPTMYEYIDRIAPRKLQAIYKWVSTYHFNGGGYIDIMAYRNRVECTYSQKESGHESFIIAINQGTLSIATTQFHSPHKGRGLLLDALCEEFDI